VNKTLENFESVSFGALANRMSRIANPAGFVFRKGVPLEKGSLPCKFIMRELLLRGFR